MPLGTSSQILYFTLNNNSSLHTIQPKQIILVGFHLWKKIPNGNEIDRNIIIIIFIIIFYNNYNWNSILFLKVQWEKILGRIGGIVDPCVHLIQFKGGDSSASEADG